MKASQKIITVTLLLMLGCSASLFAQQSFAFASQKSTDVNTSITADENSSANEVVADPLMISRLYVLCPNATNLKWSNNADNYWVSFLNNGRKANGSFTPKGKMNYMITECTMENLPADFSSNIANSYASYQLRNAIEIKAHGAVAYQAILENSKGYVTLKYTSDNIEEVQKIKKQ